MRMLLTESLTNAPISIRASWTKLRLRRSMDSIFIKVVWFQEINLELLTLRVSILKPVVEHMLTTPPKSDGSSSLRHKESLMVSSDCIMSPLREPLMS